MSNSPKDFFEHDVIVALNGRATVPRAPSPADKIADVWAVQPTAAFARLVDFLGSQGDCRPVLGEFYAFDPDDWLPGSGNTFDYMMSEWFRRVASFSGTLRPGSRALRDARRTQQGREDQSSR